ncbi:hypothetical protein ACIP2X_19320 [Streptomyces sp. NPDC089424]
MQDIVPRAWAGENQQAIADEHGIDRSDVSKLKHGHRWKRVTTMNA